MQAGPYFSEGEKYVALSRSLSFYTIWASFHASSRAPCSCHSLLLKTILKFWSVGCTLMRFTWANISERRILVSNFGMARNSFWELHPLDWVRHVCALPENRLRRRHVLKYTTQLPCIRRLTFTWILSKLFYTPLIMFPRPMWHWSVTGPRSCQSPFFSKATELLSSFILDLFVGCFSQTDNYTWSCRTRIQEGATFHQEALSQVPPR